MILLPTLYHTAPALSSQFHNIPICPAGLHGHFAQCPTGGQKNANFSQKYFKNPLTNPLLRGIICRRCEKQPHGGIAQLARATGSYPVGHRFKSGFRYQYLPLPVWGAVITIWPGGQAAKTPPFHGGNTGSIPVRVTKAKRSTLRAPFCFADSLSESGPRQVP